MQALPGGPGFQKFERASGVLHTSTIPGGSSLGPGTAAECGCCPQALIATAKPCRSLEETVALVNGVEACGGGKWADIKKRNYRAIEHRSAVSGLVRVLGLGQGCWGCSPQQQRGRSDVCSV